MVHRESRGELFVRLEVLFEGIFRGWFGGRCLTLLRVSPRDCLLRNASCGGIFISMRFLA